MPLSDIVEVKTVLDSGAFTSLLTISVQNWSKNTTTVFMFKCEDAKVSTSSFTGLLRLPCNRDEQLMSFYRLKACRGISLEFFLPGEILQ